MEFCPKRHALNFQNPAGEAFDDPGLGRTMLTNTTEIGTATLPRRRLTIPAPTDVSPSAPRRPPRFPALAQFASAARRVPRAPIPVAFALAVLAVLATVAPEPAAAQTVTTGVVSFSGDPTVGTALTATLSDPNGVSGTPTWQWARSARPDTGFTDISSATGASYTPVEMDRAFFLRATATYSDDGGSGKTAPGTTALPVGITSGVFIKNTRQSSSFYNNTGYYTVYQGFRTGDNPAGYLLTLVLVGLGAANSGDPIEVQMYRRGPGESGFGSLVYELLPPTDIQSAGDHIVDAPPGAVLEPETDYFLRVTNIRYYSGTTSRNADGGAASGWAISGHASAPGLTISSTMKFLVRGMDLLGPPGPPGSLSATGGAGSAVLTWTAPGSTGQRPVTKYQVRHKQASDPDTAFSAWSDVADSDGDGDLADELSVSVSGLAGTEYTLEVRAVNTNGAGTGAQANVAVTDLVVPSNWTLKPTALATGDKFRLLFLSSTKSAASSTDIADYNTFIQTRAAAGHTDIQDYSAGFRVVGCTAAVDARDNTSTTYTTTDKGVPVYWLNGAKAADQYEDFYDGSWDDEANDKNESGTDAHDTSVSTNYPITGCNHDGTESFMGSTSHALGASRVRSGGLNSSVSNVGPLHHANSAVHSTLGVTRPLYGLSAVFQVAADTTPPTLTSADVDGTGNSIDLQFSENVDRSNLPAATAFTVTVGGSAVTVSSVTSPSGAGQDSLLVTVSPVILQGQAVVVAYADPTTGDDANAIQDAAGNDAAAFTTGMHGVPAVTNASTATEVPSNWSLKPTGLAAGSQFRLLFLSSTKRNSSSTDIATYNTFVQGLAAAGHADIRTYSAGFRAVGCTAAVDARDNTKTTYTTTDKGVPIYWLNGAKAADQYEDFYDGSWDDEANDKNESGTNGPDTSLRVNYPWTGCDHDGTEAVTGGDSFALGTNLGDARVGLPNSSVSNAGPLNGQTNRSRFQNSPLYGLSEVFQVGAAVVVPNNPPAVANAIPDQSATAGTAFSYAFPANTFSDADTGDTLSYTATKADDTALPTWVAFTASTRTFSGTPQAADIGTVAVKVTASDGNGGSVSDEFDITVSAIVPGAPSALTATASGATQIDLSWSAPASTGGSAITGYKIEVSPNGTSGWTDQAADTNSTATTYAHTGLAAGDTRHYRVSAINTNGTGDPSNVDSATTDAVPGAVSDVVVVPVPRITDSLTVSWSAPDNAGKPALTGYDVRYRSSGGGSWTTVSEDATSTSLIIGGLRDDFYDVQVRALNADNFGPWSSTAEGATPSPPERVYANHPLIPDDLGPGDSFRLLYITGATTAATGTGIHTYHNFAGTAVLAIINPGNLVSEWGPISLGQTALVSTPGADARLLTDTSWTETDRGMPIYWLNGARVADDYADFYDGTWADEANPTNGIGQPHSLAGNAPWTGTDHDGTELFNGTASRAVGQASVSVGGLGSTIPGAGPLNGGVIFASTEERPLYGLWHVLVVDENLRLINNHGQPDSASDGSDSRAAVRAQLFTTGPNSSGYGIGGIEFANGSDIDRFLGTVALYTTDTDGDPDLANGLHATLSLERAHEFTWDLAAPAGTVLKPNTTYALVLQGDGGTYPELWTIAADGENVPADGWSLADTLLYHNGTSWVEDSNGRSLVIEMVGPQLETEGPALVSATVGAAGNAVTLVFDENVVLPSDEAEALTFLASLASAFAVTADGAGVPVSGLTASSAEPDQLTIGLSGVIVQGQAVTLTYTDPTAGDDAVALQDVLGNETPTFTTGLHGVPAVINNSTITVLTTTAPGAPTGLTATASGTTAINLSWSAPGSTGGSAITGYRIEVSSDGGSSWTNLVANTSNTTTTYAHTGLTAGTTRHYRVSAINANGAGTPSNVDSATSATAATTVPGAPTGLTATADRTSRINIGWTAPASTGGSAITGYRIEISSDGGSTWTDQVANTNSTLTTSTAAPSSPPAPRATSASRRSTPTGPASPPTSPAPPPPPPCPALRPASRPRPAGPPRSTSPGPPRRAPAAPPSPATRSRSRPMAPPAGPTRSPTPAAPPPPTRTPGLPPAPPVTTASPPSTPTAPAPPPTSTAPPPAPPPPAPRPASRPRPAGPPRSTSPGPPRRAPAAPPSPATRSNRPPMAARRGPTSSPTRAIPPPPTRTPGLPPAPPVTTASPPSTPTAPAPPPTSTAPPRAPAPPAPRPASRPRPAGPPRSTSPGAPRPAPAAPPSPATGSNRRSDGTSSWSDQVADTSSTATTYAHTGLAGDRRPPATTASPPSTPRAPAPPPTSTAPPPPRTPPPPAPRPASRPRPAGPPRSTSPGAPRPAPAAPPSPATRSRSRPMAPPAPTPAAPPPPGPTRSPTPAAPPPPTRTPG